MNKKVILEIGSGKTPFIIEGKRQIKEKESYLGLDMNSYKTQFSAFMLGVPYK